MRKRIFWTAAAAVVLAACVTAALFICGRFTELERQQNALIERLEESNAEMEEQIAALSDTVAAFQEELLSLEVRLSGASERYSDGYSYLAIGNSITVHGKCDYWWREAGMAASTEEKDYFHLVTAFLEEKYGEASSYAYNFGNWELLSTDRAETLELLDSCLMPELDLVTIQLSENVLDTTTFENDFIYLIQYIASKCPKAQIVVIDDFWSEEKSELKREAAETCGAAFADLSEIRGNAEYQCGFDTVVYGDDGTAHTVSHSGVASHPGDAGMKYIAEAVIEVLK